MFIKIEEDFRAFRSKGIGSSDMPVIMGVSPHRTIYQLWLEKTGQLTQEDQQTNPAMQRGIELEPRVREWFNLKYKRNMQPRRVVSEIDPVWRANLDGFDEQHNSILEIKVASREVFEITSRGSVPAIYYPQVQWQLLVSQARGGAFVVYNESLDDYAVAAFRPDIEYFEQLKQAAREFWHLVQTRQVPTREHKDYESIELNCKALLKSLASVDSKLEELNKKREEIVSKIRSMVEHRAHGGGYKFYWTERKGSIDYKSIPELQGLDLEKYRKPSSSVFTVRKDA